MNYALDGVTSPEGKNMVMNKTKTGVKWLKHKSGTKNRKCTVCSSWIKHHEKKSGLIRGKCSVYGCTRDATDGAHVCVSRSSSQREWIALTCSTCNPRSSTAEFRVVQNTKIVAARKCQCRSTRSTRSKR